LNVKFLAKFFIVLFTPHHAATSTTIAGFRIGNSLHIGNTLQPFPQSPLELAGSNAMDDP
jgi:hypothetical protein